MANSAENAPLPDYDRPPVVETILGVQFDRLSEFRNAHLGAFWKTLPNGDWPEVGDAPPLASQIEQFPKAARWAGAKLQLTQDPSCRLQIKNKDTDRMIQVQNGRLHFNWLGRAGGVYPRYGDVRDGFKWTLEQFRNFLASEQLGEFNANQWEVTYLNHVPQGSVWNSPDDWGFFRPLMVPNIPNVVDGESFTGEWHFAIPGQRGRLHVQWQHGFKSERDKEEIVILTLTARGEPIGEGGVDQCVLGSLDLGHETVVRAFKHLMSDEANRHWGLKDGNS